MNYITFTRINKMNEKMTWTQETERNLTTKNWDLQMIISTSLKKKNNNRLVKNLIKKNYLKTNNRWFEKKLMNGLIKKKQT